MSTRNRMFCISLKDCFVGFDAAQKYVLLIPSVILRRITTRKWSNLKQFQWKLPDIRFSPMRRDKQTISRQFTTLRRDTSKILQYCCSRPRAANRWQVVIVRRLPVNMATRLIHMQPWNGNSGDLCLDLNWLPCMSGRKNDWVCIDQLPALNNMGVTTFLCVFF